MINQKNKGGFTLVELIIVMTVLAILGIISFVSYSGYSVAARDTARLFDITNITKGLYAYQAKNGNLPMPENYVTIIASGTAIGYQGYAGASVLSSISLTTGGKDALDNTYYTYLVNANKTKFQILGFLENPSSLVYGNTAYAVDYTSRIPVVKGDQLGILTNSINNSPIQESTSLLTNNTFDIVAYSGATGVNAYYSNTDKISGTGASIGILSFTMQSGVNTAPPVSCPDGFIPVIGNTEFHQAGFCVAKYEMKQATGDAGYYIGGSRTDGTNSYCKATTRCTSTTSKDTDIGSIVSKPDGHPIVYINQYNASEACKSLGDGYHLITNNERMTIARDIEANPSNWSSGIVGSGYIYSGHNNSSPNYGLSSSNNDSDGYNQTGTSGGKQKRTLTLSNGQIIWDLAGNVREHVNKANTLDGSNYNLGLTSVSGCSAPTSLSEWTTCTDKSYTSKNTTYNSANGIGQIWNSQGAVNNIFIRGGAWFTNIDAGIFALNLFRTSGYTHYHLGFRCAK